LFVLVGAGEYACYLAVTVEVVEWDGTTLRIDAGDDLPEELPPDVNGDRMKMNEERYRRVESIESVADEEFCDF
jgi:hypothetical protein